MYAIEFRPNDLASPLSALLARETDDLPPDLDVPV
jgi:hypothetical protein